MSEKVKVERLDNAWLIGWQSGMGNEHREACTSFDDVVRRQKEILDVSYYEGLWEGEKRDVET